MTFEEILDQAIAMLQRRGRVTYRTLRLQFQLDEEQLEALKEALIDAEQLAVDEEGRVLVWAGPSALPPAAGAGQGHTVGCTCGRAYGPGSGGCHGERRSAGAPGHGRHPQPGGSAAGAGSTQHGAGQCHYLEAD